MALDHTKVRISHLVLAIVTLTAVVGGIGGYVGGYIGGTIGALIGLVAPLTVTVFQDRHARRQRVEVDFLEVGGPRPERQWREEDGFAALLRPDLGVVRFVGRTEDLTRLRDWTNDHRGGPVLLVTGGAGVGKTRLALKLVEVMEEAGWLCTSVRQGMEAVAVDRTVAMAKRGPARRRSPTAGALLVVDYAETRAGIEDMLRQAVGASITVRILLLARDAGEWWKRLTATVAAREALAATQPMTLGSQVVADQNDERMALAAVPWFARVLKVPVVQDVTISMGFDEQPSMLNLHAVALVAVLTGQSSLHKASDDVVDDVIKHEERYWLGTARREGLRDRDMPMLRRAAAIACLIPVPTEDSVIDDVMAATLERVPELRGTPPDTRYAVARWLRALYPAGSSSGVGSLQPDLFAERHVCTQLAGSAEFARLALSELSDAQAHHSLTVLSRATRHDPAASRLLRNALSADLRNLARPAIEVAIQTGGELAGILADVLKRVDADLQTLREILMEIRDQTVTLSRAAAIAAQRVADMAQGSSDADLAYALADAGARWLYAGELGQAKANLARSVALYQRLAGSDPSGEIEKHYAWALSNLGKAWSQDDPRMAVGYVRQSVEIYERHAESGDEMRRGLAAGLRSLGEQVDDPTAAQDFTERSLRIFETLAAASEPTSEEYLSDIAACLDNLGTLWRDNQPARARSVHEQAVNHYRRLVQSNPDGHRPGLAYSLTNLGEFLLSADTGSATSCLLEAVAAYRILAERDPRKFEPDLAWALTRLAEAHGHAKEVIPATVVSQEAVNLLERLVVDDASRFEPDLAAALSALGEYYWIADRDAERAFSPAQRAADMYERMCDSGGHYQAELATALDRLARLWTVVDPERAADLMGRAVASYRAVRQTAGDVVADLVRSLVALASLNARLGDTAAAVSVIAEALGQLESVSVDEAEATALRAGMRRARRTDPSAFDETWRETVRAPMPEWLRNGQESPATVAAVDASAGGIG
jgi:tetratricopeptide (TPR) repeat protein